MQNQSNIAKKINQHILLVHGNMDEWINIKYARANFSKIPSIKKQLLEIDTAKHADLWRIGRDDYFDKTLGF